MTLKLLFVNFLTLLRVIGTIILIPIYHYFGGLKAGIFSLIFDLTDIFDGVLARKWKVSTFFGSLFDGCADKLFTIINFIILYLITPYALIPIILEIITILLQLVKFANNYNIQSNIFGKIKVWFLTASLVLLFILSDITNATFIPLNIREFILSEPSKTLYFWVLLPAIIMEVITLISYVFEMFKPPKKIVDLDVNKKLKKDDYKDLKGYNYFKEIWLNPTFYKEHSNNTNLKDLWNLTRNN